jgi:hypothetical protein
MLVFLHDSKYALGTLRAILYPILVANNLAFGSHALLSLSMCLSTTGLGQDQVAKILKNREITVVAQPLGYSWHTLATRIAHATPPKYPMALE